jgi:acyl CoA:acetate/3-ketoacid CoA transferase alpha subunit
VYANKIVELGELDPHEVVTPGVFVDIVITDEVEEKHATE